VGKGIFPHAAPSAPVDSKGGEEDVAGTGEREDIQKAATGLVIKTSAHSYHMRDEWVNLTFDLL
jgi:hypothetical protein